MAKPNQSRNVGRKQRTPLFSAVLLTIVIIETVLASWGFVHVGNGSNASVAVQRYGYGAAELLTIIAASTAGCAWLAYKFKRYGAIGLFVCLGLSLLWNLFLGYPPGDGAKSLPGHGTFVVVTIVFTVSAALGGWIVLAPLWPRLERY